MKTNKNAGNTVKKTYELPKEICEMLEESAEKNLRSINFELIHILQEYFKSDSVKWEPHTKKLIDEYARRKGSSFSWAANYLISTKISVTEEVEDMIIDEANKEYEAAMSADLEKTMTGT